MRTNKKITLLLIPFSMSLGLTFPLSGCATLQEPVRALLPPNSAETQQSGLVRKRFQETTQQGPTVAEAAMELSKKYAKLSEEATTLRQRNQNFTDENRLLKDKVVALEGQLQQTQKELTEANDLLREMLIELNNWKTDVIGFRGEMRNAEKAQLEALLKILKVLGGEVKTSSTQDKNIGPVAVSQSGSPQPAFMETPVLGEQNEYLKNSIVVTAGSSLVRLPALYNR